MVLDRFVNLNNASVYPLNSTGLKFGLSRPQVARYTEQVIAAVSERKELQVE
jgi:hypothetical protein